MQKTIPNTLTYITGELLGYQKAELIPTQKIWYSENQDTASIRKTSEKLTKSAFESIQMQIVSAKTSAVVLNMD